LRAQEGIAARALEFTILTAARTGEAIGARLEEVDKTNRLWTVPSDRMKASEEHRVPLATRAMAILEMVGRHDLPENSLIFSGGRAGAPLSNMAMLKLLERMGRTDLTVHGFRSTFRDWAAERTDFPSEVVEQALAHSIPSKTEAAYRRGDLLKKRQDLMDDWAEFCCSAVAKVVRLHTGGR
jgi:integrase